MAEGIRKEGREMPKSKARRKPHPATRCVQASGAPRGRGSGRWEHRAICPVGTAEPEKWSAWVAKGRCLVKGLHSHQWQLGDLALQVQPMGQRGVSNGLLERIVPFAEAIGLESSTLGAFRLAAAKWPPNTRCLRSSWNAHQALAGEADRFELIAKRTWTVKEARDFVAGRMAKDLATVATVEDLVGATHAKGAKGPSVVPLPGDDPFEPVHLVLVRWVSGDALLGLERDLRAIWEVRQ